MPGMSNFRSPSRAIGACVLALLLAAAGACSQEPQEDVKPSQPKQGPKPNRLAKETSPYLRQHQFNPVDWHPWGEEALALAKKLDKPIFLSIGYAACHWCHVMEHESFENEAMAKVMNEHFVCIKVDREERPDLDEIYMAAVQAMIGSGGWPMSVWLTPDGQPFYGGTYFPPEDMHGRPGFRRVCDRVAGVWKERREEVLTSAQQLTDHIASTLAPELAPGEPTEQMLAGFLPQSSSRWDEDHGGFGQPPHYAPKFPHASELMVLMRLPDAGAAALVEKTLQGMRNQGMYDQLGGGFHRYSTDREWLVPHFEKMLYDNALLVPCYLEQFLRSGDHDHANTARDTLKYLLREMRHERGGFYSSQDADSEGVEGKFFVWTDAEVGAVLGEEKELGRKLYGFTPAGNWEGHNIPVRTGYDPETGIDPDQRGRPGVRWRVETVRQQLWQAREQRVKPGTDDKILCAWNGLAISAFAAAYRVLGEAAHLEAARGAAAFVLDELVIDGRCKRSWHSGEARHAGVLEDYALLADALLSLFECDGDPRWLGAGKQLLVAIDAHFGAEDGGFWFTADDHEQLLTRTKTMTEASTPAGAAIAVRAFLRGGLLLGDTALYERGVAGLRQNHALLSRSPIAASSLVLALQFHLDDPREVVIAGQPDDPRTRALLEKAWRSFPGHHVTALVHDGNRAALTELSPVFRGKVPVDGAPAAYVCRRGVCAAPVTDPTRLVLQR